MNGKVKITDPAATASTGAYSLALKVAGFVFISGPGPIDGEGRIVPGPIGAQIRLTLQNVRRLIEAGGGRLDHVVKCTCYLADIATFAEFNAGYREFFADPLPRRRQSRLALTASASRSTRSPMSRVETDIL
jgi:2-iminobutanoate/2-iminopropanoate deaminase